MRKALGCKTPGFRFFRYPCDIIPKPSCFQSPQEFWQAISFATAGCRCNDFRNRILSRASAKLNKPCNK